MRFLGDPASIERAASELDAADVVLTGVLDDLTPGVGGLVPASWDGDAAHSFQGHWATDASAINALARVIVQVASILSGLATELRRAQAAAQHAENVASSAGLRFDADGQVAGYVAAGRFALPLTPAQEQTRIAAQAAMDAARTMADTARSHARGALSAISVPQVRPGVSAASAARWSQGTAPGQPGFGDWVRDNAAGFASDAGQIALGGLSIDGGLSLIGAGGAGEVSGIALDATGVGTIGGVALNVVSAGAVVVGGGLVAGGAIAAGHGIVDAVGRIGKGIGILFARKQQPPELSAEERQAIEDRAQGRPDYDRRAYNRAQQKIKQGEKYQGQRNKQKRQSSGT